MLHEHPANFNGRSAERWVHVPWVQRLKRVLGIHIENCRTPGGGAHACIEAPVVIEKIVTQSDKKDASAEASQVPA